ncbi:MAG TPA: hypothetical protein DCR27_09405 [Lachnospiraceae bacterium]|nr:hypothetical protein [Lachnospiraceae bacterium]
MEAYREKLKKYYDTEGKLVQYPSKRPMRILAMTKIAEKFAHGKTYTEKEVNAVIRESIAFGDIELVRREMFQYRFIGRFRDGSAYWAEPDWRERYQEYLEISGI